MAPDQRFQAAASYWLIRPPRMGRRRIPPRIGLGSRRVRAWRAEAQRSMGSLAVLVHQVLGERLAQVPLAEDQHSVGELGADGQHEAFGVAVRAWAARRDLEYFDSCVGHDRVE